MICPLPSVCRSANVQEALNTAVMLVDVSYPKWRILFCNGQFDKATGLSGSDVAGQHVWDHFTVVGKSEVCPSSYTLPISQFARPPVSCRRAMSYAYEMGRQGFITRSLWHERSWRVKRCHLPVCFALSRDDLCQSTGPFPVHKSWCASLAGISICLVHAHAVATMTLLC